MADPMADLPDDIDLPGPHLVLQLAATLKKGLETGVGSYELAESLLMFLASDRGVPLAEWVRQQQQRRVPHRHRW